RFSRDWSSDVCSSDLERSRLVYISNRGVLADVRSSMYNVRRPLQQILIGDGMNRNVETLSSMEYFDNGQILLSGTFNRYEASSTNDGSTYTEVNNITILNNNLTLDTIHVRLVAWG